MNLQPQENVSLKDYSTMRVGGSARYLLEATDKAQIPAAVDWAKNRGLPMVTLGEGSNVVFRDEGYPGLVLVSRFKGIGVLEEDEDYVTVRAAAGEKWDDVVAFSVEKNLSGIEALTAVPGTVGGAPVQNIGCYGQELSDTLTELEAYDVESKKFVVLGAPACEFRYRDSIFKSTHPGSQKGRFVITSITLKLSKRPTLKKPLYETLQRFMDQKSIDDTSPKTIRKALLEWRGIYLPDPSVIPSNGSFFRNPIISKHLFDELKRTYPEIKGWPLDDSKPHHRDYENNSGPMVKVAAAWLVKTAAEGRDFDSKLRLHDKQKIVITNPSGASYAELEDFVQKITGLVEQKFGITLQPEPELI
jgi:UDP-N-acetylmuramate dehydrogenase